jgi:S-DNA-T family DNA segregation ATPase FtsK/SpoIIIE
VALVVLAALCALSIYSGLAGPVGRRLDHGAVILIGGARVLLPLALAYLGWTVIRGRGRAQGSAVSATGRVTTGSSRRSSSDRTPGPGPGPVSAPAPGRVALGAAVLLVAIAALIDQIDGPHHWRAITANGRVGGGVIGAGVGVPLRAGIGPGGAVVVLLALTALALLVATGTRASDALHRIGVGLARAGRTVMGAGKWAIAAFRRAERRAASARHPSAGHPGLYDREADESAEQEAIGQDLDEVDAGLLAAGDASAAGVGRMDTATAAEAAGGAVATGGGAGAPASAAARTQASQRGQRPAQAATSSSAEAEQLAIALGPAAEPGRWRLPPLALLKRSKATEIDRRHVESLGHTLEAALAAHGVETRLAGMTVGPTVTRYELELGPGVKVAKVTNLQRDIAYAMAAADVRILAPIPGRSAIGVEVPNQQRQLVALGDILTSAEAHAATHPLEVALGRDIAGRPILENLATMPHILIAGATGAGKSSCINSLVTSILLRATPEQVRLILVDPKRVELGQYNGLPHLLTGVVTNPKKAANALSWAVHEMERRYDLLAEVGVRDISGYNAAFDRGELESPPGLGEEPRPYERLPFVLVVVDELNDLMMVAARDVEESICRIAQMARAVGIHLVIATQRPSVDVITGVIKANIPSRLAFAVSSLADSRVILDQPGAERLIGQGDMLLLGASSSVARRIQGAWVAEDEVRKVVAHWRRQSEPRYVDGVEGRDDGPGGSDAFGDEDDDELLEQAKDLVVRSQLGSTSMLQRKLRIGFARAGRLMDLLERRGIVGPSEGSKARTVLMTVEEYEGDRADGFEAGPNAPD